jgi:hypothetical protein
LTYSHAKSSHTNVIVLTYSHAKSSHTNVIVLTYSHAKSPNLSYMFLYRLIRRTLINNH